jgi:8-oxo-dGTP pyrophosphatase MutT (NUDIX family)
MQGTLVDAFFRTAYRGAYSLALAWWFVRRPVTEGVLAGVWHGRRVLLLQNSYKRPFGLPGGGAHRGESREETGARELREEVGLSVEPHALRLVFEVEGTDEFKHDRVYFVELEVEAEPPIAVDRREVEWADFIDAETALRLPLQPLVRAYLEEAVRRRGLLGGAPGVR